MMCSIVSKLRRVAIIFGLWGFGGLEGLWGPGVDGGVTLAAAAPTHESARPQFNQSTQELTSESTPIEPVDPELESDFRFLENYLGRASRGDISVQDKQRLESFKRAVSSALKMDLRLLPFFLKLNSDLGQLPLQSMVDLAGLRSGHDQSVLQPVSALQFRSFLRTLKDWQTEIHSLSDFKSRIWQLHSQYYPMLEEVLLSELEALQELFSELEKRSSTTVDIAQFARIFSLHKMIETGFREYARVRQLSPAQHPKKNLNEMTDYLGGVAVQSILASLLGTMLVGWAGAPQEFLQTAAASFAAVPVTLALPSVRSAMHKNRKDREQFTREQLLRKYADAFPGMVCRILLYPSESDASPESKL